MSPPNPLENLVALDADITDTLSASPPNPSIDPESAARVKRRILKRIAQTQAGHVTVHPSDSNWQPIHRGVDIKVLHQAGDILSYLLRLAPSSEHTAIEWMKSASSSKAVCASATNWCLMQAGFILLTKVHCTPKSLATKAHYFSCAAPRRIHH